MDIRAFIENAIQGDNSIGFDALVEAIKEAERNEPYEAYTAHIRAIYDEVVKRNKEVSTMQTNIDNAIKERIDRMKYENEHPNPFVIQGATTIPKRNSVIQGYRNEKIQ